MPERSALTGYAAVQRSIFLRHRISLPPLDEQRRIVARIEELSSKIEEARTLQQKAIEESDRMVDSIT